MVAKKVSSKGRGGDGAGAEKKVKKAPKGAYIDNTVKSFRIGGDVIPKKDLTRYVKFPRYVRLQRQRRILLQRLKIPPALNQFNMALKAAEAQPILAMLEKYKPETRAEKKERLNKAAQTVAEGGEASSLGKKPVLLKYGLNHLTDLVENKMASLLVIAHDVDPVEMVLWLPALCRKKEVPYCIVKGKARLGQLVHQKTASAVALTAVRKDDQNELKRIQDSCMINFNQNDSMRKQWGGGERGLKSRHVLKARQRAEELHDSKRVFSKVK